MLISRISGRKGTNIFFYLQLSQPFFEFASPLALVFEAVFESPAVSADGVTVERCGHLVLDECLIVADAVFYGYGAVIATVHDEGGWGLCCYLQFVAVEDDEIVGRCLAYEALA